MTDLVDAAVPAEWAVGFIGHRIWSRPTAKPGAHAEWVEMLDVWEETHPAGDASRLHASIMWRGQAWSAQFAPKVYVQDVPAEQCTFLEWDRDGEQVRYYMWTPPIDDPPVLETHPPGWEPPPARRAPDPLPIVPTEFGDQFALPI